MQRQQCFKELCQFFKQRGNLLRARLLYHQLYYGDDGDQTEYTAEFKNNKMPTVQTVKASRQQHGEVTGDMSKMKIFFHTHPVGSRSFPSYNDLMQFLFRNHSDRHSKYFPTREQDDITNLCEFVIGDEGVTVYTVSDQLYDNIEGNPIKLFIVYYYLSMLEVMANSHLYPFERGCGSCLQQKYLKQIKLTKLMDQIVEFHLKQINDGLWKFFESRIRDQTVFSNLPSIDDVLLDSQFDPEIQEIQSIKPAFLVKQFKFPQIDDKDKQLTRDVLIGQFPL